MQVDKPVLDADPVQRLAGVAAVFGANPGLVVVDVAALEVGTVVDLGMGLAKPGPKLAKDVLDVLDRRRSQTQVDVGDVALGGLGEPGRDRRPAGDRHRQSAGRTGVVLHAACVEQSEL